jgi:pyruvate formate lyase activating enzyme
MQGPLPLVFDIHRFALDDGPGIRTTVFLKGCPLSCRWCHNPESMSVEPEIAFYPDRCIGCGSCRDICPEAAITDGPPLQIDRLRCTTCGRCADICPAAALRMMGKEYPVDDLLEIILRDRHFFEASGGGVTFSGGEPTLGMNYLSRLLAALKAEGLHTAIQTCGLFDYDRFARKVLPFADLIMFDIKFIDAAEHQKHTGRDNTSILQNFSQLAKKESSRLLPRVPLVPGITATPGNLMEIASFFSDLGILRCDLLSYNPAGIDKRQAIRVEQPPFLPNLPLSSAEENNLRNLFENTLHSISKSRLDAGKYSDDPQGGLPCRSTFIMQ